MPEQLMPLGVDRHPLRHSDDRRVGVGTPEERDQREGERRHLAHLHRRTPGLRDPLRRQEASVDRPVRIDLDLHLEAGLNDPGGITAFADADRSPLTTCVGMDDVFPGISARWRRVPFR